MGVVCRLEFPLKFLSIRHGERLICFFGLFLCLLLLIEAFPFENCHISSIFWRDCSWNAPNHTIKFTLSMM